MWLCDRTLTHRKTYATLCGLTIGAITAGDRLFARVLIAHLPDSSLTEAQYREYVAPLLFLGYLGLLSALSLTLFAGRLAAAIAWRHLSRIDPVRFAWILRQPDMRKRVELEKFLVEINLTNGEIIAAAIISNYTQIQSEPIPKQYL